MKITLRKTLSLLLAVILVFSVCSVSFAVGEENTTATVTGFTEKDYLTTKGTKIVNAEGKEVILKGVNLGSWLILEDWLSPYDEATDNISILDTLTERFGEEKAYELMNIYQDNWITEYDLDEIKAMGFNCVRVPFWFRNFYYDDNGRKILDENGDWDFSRLDWVVKECKERELYVILDMHGAVGYQSDALHNGKQGGCGLFDATEQGERYRELTDELWTAIATRFKGEPTVAMYDLLNEPMCDVNCTEVKRRINNESIYTRLYDTVRAVDDDHIITMECIWTAAALPHSFFKGWTNVVYQLHFYNNNNAIFNFFVLMSRLWQFNVPLIMGEFYPLGSTTWNNCFKTMNTLGVSWMLWTYKGAGHGMWDSDWVLRGSKDGFHRAKIQTDSYDEIARKWGEEMRTENGYQDTGHYDNNVKAYL